MVSLRRQMRQQQREVGRVSELFDSYDKDTHLPSGFAVRALCPMMPRADKRKSPLLDAIARRIAALLHPERAVAGSSAARQTGWWNPAVEDQATDRTDRIGQSRTVFVHRLMVEGTLEDKIDALIGRKRSIAGQVVQA